MYGWIHGFHKEPMNLSIIAALMEELNILSNTVLLGEIFSSESALNLGLIDKIGTKEEALKELMETYGLPEKIREYSPRRTVFERMLSSSISAAIIDRFIGSL